ncbi:FAD-dependent oxidoreductase [Carboxydochorda subterranea]|uniref:FAD-dependent oxidoreductase n=1 Tax=Carboxydichorda subterranea TaxID=3109565 RepID=A0ABZ1BYJ2_9FIRM|nr:FAD-dependent oxidoreductase [Limnochorda sp. L945t]WRP17585.1 FAD-dependent oxidoreductase [Limnochorda sp. L945t]
MSRVEGRGGHRGTATVVRTEASGDPAYAPAGRFDVVVAGGGTAGSVAAIAAARNGARTLLVEEQGFLGGTATGALVTPLMPNRLGQTNLNRGITDEIKARLATMGGGGATPENDGWFDPEALKAVLEEMALEAGVQLLYYTRVIEALVETADGGPRQVTGVLVHNKSGLQRIRARVVVDATGDADVAASAGCEMRSGGEQGERQAFSVRWIAGGVDVPKLARFVESLGGQPWPAPYFEAAMVWGRGHVLEDVFRRAVEAGDLLEADGEYFQCFSVPGRADALAFNCPRIARRVDGTSAEDLTWAQIEGRRAIRRLVAFVRKYLPGCEGAYVQQVAPMVGVRESRRIVGDYVLTLDDIVTGRKFQDAVARNRYPVDIHLVRDGGRGGGGLVLGSGRPPEGDFHEIPYRCLLPRGVEGLLVAGRSVSATFEAQSAIRIQPNCHSLGQAAGTAAALAAARGVTPRGLDAALLRQILREQGAYV